MYDVYTIKENDTLENIALKFNTNIYTIKNINSNISNLEVGEKIIIPVNQNSYFTCYFVKKGETIYDISKKFDISYKNILFINGLEENDYLYESQKLFIPKDNVGIYITNGNDTLSSVANKLKICEEIIIQSNKTIYLLQEQMIFYKKSQ